MAALLGVLLFIVAVFLILLVLVQKGKGGGLAGAFGGMGGQSAFGTKAGDLFTKITVGVAAFWIVLCILSIRLLDYSSQRLSRSLGGGSAETTAPVNPGAPAGADEKGNSSPDQGDDGSSSSAPAEKTPAK